MKIALYISLFFASFFSLEAATYKIYDLGTTSAKESFSSGISTSKIVAGSLLTEDNQKCDFSWDPSKGLTLIPVESGKQIPLINNNQEIVGLLWHKTSHWLYGDTRTQHLYLIDSTGKLNDIGAPPNWDVEELGLAAFNDHGQIIIANANHFSKTTHYSLWENGQFRELDAKHFRLIYGLNNQGILLCIYTENGEDPRLVLYDLNSQKITPIGVFKSLFFARVNELGEVFLVEIEKESNILLGKLWSEEKSFTDLGSFVPLAFNNRHQMIGWVMDKSKKTYIPFLWNEGELINLNEALKIGTSESPWADISVLRAINDNGYIVGRGTLNGKKQAFVIEPVETIDEVDSMDVVDGVDKIED